MMPYLSRNKFHLVVYVAINPSELYATLFRLHYRLWYIKVPRSAISMRLASLGVP